MNSVINFKKGEGLIPAIVQDYKNKQVLMLGFMNEESFKKTLKTNFVWFWSRSKKRLWMKGEMSGNKLKVKKITKDCDSDSLLLSVECLGEAVCHKNTKSCFQEVL